MKQGRALQHARGFSLLDMLVVIALLGVFAMIANGLFMGTFRVVGESKETMKQMSRFDEAVRLLNEDVQSAASITVEHPGRVVLVITGINQVVWEKVTNENEDKQEAFLVRTHHYDYSVDKSRLMNVPDELAFEEDTNGLKVINGKDTMNMTSLPMLLGGKP